MPAIRAVPSEAADGLWYMSSGMDVSKNRLIRSATLTGYPEAARDVGLDPEAMLNGVGLQMRCMDDPDTPIPLDAFLQLLADSAAQSGCTDFGMRAAIRRGTSTLHTDFGTTNAILAGDWLFSRSFRLVADYADLKSARVLARFVGGICAAEIGQDLGKFGFSTSKRSYLRTIAGKTAALFSLSLHVGASEAKADPLVIQALRRTGYDIGMAFQIIDDILDYESDDKTLRKPVGNDIKEGLCTLPLILALKKDESSLRPLLGKPMDDRKISEILRIVLATGALDEARSIAQRFTARARVEIERLPSCPAKQELMNASEALLQRRY